MSDQDKVGGCRWCASPAYMKQGRLWLCQKHYRFQQMRANAKRNGKSVPEYETLQSLVDGNVDLICPGCRKPMYWTAEHGLTSVLSLQHDRDGGVRFLCRSCNTRHAGMPGDTFYLLPDAHKLCHACSQVLPLEKFYKDVSRFANARSYCKKCMLSSAMRASAATREQVITTLTDYFREYGDILLQTATERTRPLHTPGKDPEVTLNLLRKPKKGQHARVTAAVKSLNESQCVQLACATGTGKTYLSIATCEGHAKGKPYRAMVVCPPHLVK